MFAKFFTGSMLCTERRKARKIVGLGDLRRQEGGSQEVAMLISRVRFICAELMSLKGGENQSERFTHPDFTSAPL
jgi:hypothetical protein